MIIHVTLITVYQIIFINLVLMAESSTIGSVYVQSGNLMIVLAKPAKTVIPAV